MNKKLYKWMNWPEIEGIIYADEAHPERLLGAHVKGSQTLVQVFLPHAKEVTLVTDSPKKEYPMELADEDGFFAVLIPGKGNVTYYLRVTDKETGKTEESRDPYSYLPQLSAEDKAKWNAGTHYHTYEFMGAHETKVEGISGVLFRVWAPEAVRVSVIGEFNHFDGRVHPMCFDEETGIYTLFIPGLKAGIPYQYEIRRKGGALLVKNDPYAAAFTTVEDRGRFSLTAKAARTERKALSPDQKSEKTAKSAKSTAGKAKTSVKRQDNTPILIYELNLNDFLAESHGRYETAVKELAQRLKKLGYTHAALTGVLMEDRTRSAVHVPLSFYGLNPGFQKEEDLKLLVDTLHGQGVAVIMDYAAACFGGSGQETLSAFDGSCLYEHLDYRQGYHPSFGVSLFHYGRPQVTDYLISAAARLVEEFAVDGLRFCDTSFILYLDYGKQNGEWLPNMYGGNENLEGIEFLKHSCSVLKKMYPSLLLITDEFSGWRNLTAPLSEEGFGFDYKWNYAYANELLRYLALNPINRSQHHHEITMSALYMYLEKFVLAFSGDYLAKCECGLNHLYGQNNEDLVNAQKKLLYTYTLTHPGKKYFMPMFDDAYDTFLADANSLYLDNPALHMDDSEESFEWINNISADECVLLFLRKSESQTLLVAVNFANCAWENHKVGVPFDGKYKEIFSTEDAAYQGSGTPNPRVIKSKKDECDMREDSVRITLAPLSVSVFSYVPYTEKELEQMKQKALEKEKKQEEARKKKEALKKKKEKIRASLKEELARKIAAAEEEIARGSEYGKGDRKK